MSTGLSVAILCEKRQETGMGTFFDARKKLNSVLESSQHMTKEFVFYLTKIELKMP